MFITQLRARARAVKGNPGVSANAARFATTFDASAFQKGNVHTHTDLSDGDSAPEDVILWYRSHGYQFLALTDHRLRSDPSDYASLQDETFRLIPGEEVSMIGRGRRVHVNALCTKRTIGGPEFGTTSDALAWAVSEIEGQGGVALINHPNFDRAIDASDLLAARGAPLLEIMSGHPYVFSEGVGGRPSHEALWDWALAHDIHFMGAAVDDMHHLAEPGDPPAYPGRAWVEVFAERNDPETICEALRRGMLYASTGAELSRIRVTSRSYSVWPRENAVVSFVGRGGLELSRVAPRSDGEAASYTPRLGDSYVRAKVMMPDGRMAWAPAVYVLGGGP